MKDIELIRLAQRGEKKAFHELISLYYPYVTRFLLKLTQSQEISEDITQETFLKLIQKIDCFDVNGTASFSTYIITISKNLYIDYIRKNKHIALCFDEQIEQASSFQLEQTVENLIDTEDLMEKLELIPPEQALAIKLKYIERLTLNEIALRTSCEPKTIKSRIHNGITKLRRLSNRT